MYHIHYLNPISPKGTALWTEDYHTTPDAADADAILVRSAAMHDMEFSEKLLALRKQKGWTQEELAEALYVSRTAISKWESGRGYPNIESLKAISKLFSVSIDNLLSNEELITVAETDSKEKAHKTHTVIFGLVDCMVGLLIFLPFFSQQFGEQYISVSIMQLTDISAYIHNYYII